MDDEFLWMYCISIVGICIVILIVRIMLKLIKTDYKDNILEQEEIKNEFEDFYQKIYDENIDKLKMLKKRVRNGTTSIYLAGLILLIASCFSQKGMYVWHNGYISFIIILFIIAILFIFITINKDKKYKKIYMGFESQEYRNLYKSKVITKLVQLINNKLIYKYNDIDCDKAKREYLVADFDKKKFNKVYVDDYIIGYIEDKQLMEIYNLNTRYIIDIRCNEKTGNSISRNICEYFY